MPDSVALALKTTWSASNDRGHVLKNEEFLKCPFPETLSKECRFSAAITDNRFLGFFIKTKTSLHLLWGGEGTRGAQGPTHPLCGRPCHLGARGSRAAFRTVSGVGKGSISDASTRVP